MDVREAEQLFQHHIQLARNFRREGKEIPTTFILVMPDGALVVMPLMPDLDKDTVVALVKHVAKSMGAQYVLHLCECWVAMQTAPNETPVSERPDRIEALMVSIDGPGLSKVTIIAIQPDGSLGEPLNFDTFSGRMANLSNQTNTPLEC
jgi:hypothetical protein